jgi:adenylosuccinate synthase
MFKRLILLSGPVGSGKSTLASSLEKEFGVRVIKTRQILAQETGSANERGNLQTAGETLDKKTNGAWVANGIQRVADSPEFGDYTDVLVDVWLRF